MEVSHVTEVTPDRRLQFDRSMMLCRADGNLDVIPSLRLRLSSDEAVSGMSPQDKEDLELKKLILEIMRGLFYKDRATPTDLDLAEKLENKEPVFAKVPEESIEETFRTVAKALRGTPGLILFPETAQKISYLTALRTEEETYRLAKRRTKEGWEDTAERMKLISPVERAVSMDDTIFYTIKFVKNGERPKKITRSELEDWLERARESRLIFGFDVTKNIPGNGGLDNLLRIDGKLTWIDGNIVAARPAVSEEELELFIKNQREILETYL